MVVKQDEGSRIGHKSRLQDVRDRCDRLIQLADADDIEIDRLELRVEIHHAKALPVELGHFLPHYLKRCSRGGERNIRI